MVDWRVLRSTPGAAEEEALVVVLHFGRLLLDAGNQEGPESTDAQSLRMVRRPDTVMAVVAGVDENYQRGKKSRVLGRGSRSTVMVTVAWVYLFRRTTLLLRSCKPSTTHHAGCPGFFTSSLDWAFFHHLRPINKIATQITRRGDTHALYHTIQSHNYAVLCCEPVTA
ncbi:hypothetical protein RIF29_39639 [Crotalaria pallida]|uniref:Uncharacterized protein n=1 Tax=Crotalaria pallida TaxID=3830 RepID=A0AAN9E417_CROPI